VKKNARYFLSAPPHILHVEGAADAGLLPLSLSSRIVLRWDAAPFQNNVAIKELESLHGYIATIMQGITEW
jgi:hypothetical protein